MFQAMRHSGAPNCDCSLPGCDSAASRNRFDAAPPCPAMKRAALTVLILAVAASAFAGTPQTITFPAIAHQITTGEPMALDAHGQQRAAGRLQRREQRKCGHAEWNTLTLTGTAGLVTVKASQAGDPTYDPAPAVYRTFAVGDASQRFVKICTGSRHFVGIRADGSLWAWGRNFDGQLGTGSPGDQLSPVRIGNDTNWASVACGEDHTVAVRTDGTLWSWGFNFYGQLGGGIFQGRWPRPSRQ